MEKAAKITHTSRNIFADIGIPNPEVHALKAQLVMRMIQVMRARKLTQVAAAKIMKLKQPDVSNLIRGQFRGYSLERLVELLRALDQEVEIVVRYKVGRKRRVARRSTRRVGRAKAA